MIKGGSCPLKQTGDSVGESVNSEATSDSDGSDSGLITDTSDEDASSNHQ